MIGSCWWPPVAMLIGFGVVGAVLITILGREGTFSAEMPILNCTIVLGEGTKATFYSKRYEGFDYCSCIPGPTIGYRQAGRIVKHGRIVLQVKSLERLYKWARRGASNGRGIPVAHLTAQECECLVNGLYAYTSKSRRTAEKALAEQLPPVC